MRLWLATCVGATSLVACAAPEPPRPNVVLYVIDTLRADRIGLYGSERATSPNIDALGEAGVVFEQASAPAPWTLPSVASLALSQLPCEHRVLVDRDTIAPASETLAAQLRAAGYRTASFHSNPYAGSMSGLDAGFDVAQFVKQRQAERAVARWLDGQGEQPFFLYFHTIEPHNPEQAKNRFLKSFGAVPPNVVGDFEETARLYRSLTRADFVEKQPLGTTDNTEEQKRALGHLDELRESVDLLYDATVLEADARLGRIVETLRERGLWENTIFIVLSDHGEELGDRGGWLHDHSVYEELVQVPLIARFPDPELQGIRVHEPVSLIDVAPTLLDYLRLERPDTFRGGDLFQSENALRVVALRDNQKKYFRPYKELRGDVNVVLRQGMWKGIWNAEIDTFELYELEADPLEQMDTSEDRELAESMRAFAHSQLVQCRQRAKERPDATMDELDETTRRQLESLGYVDSKKEP